MASTLTVWKFDDPDRAEHALGKLEQLAKQRLITVDDAAIVSWPKDKKKPKTRELHNLTGGGAVWGGFWGLLLGLIFFVPILGLALGAAGGALAGNLTRFGIGDEFIDDVRSKVTPGTSALFLLSQNEVIDRILPEVDPEGVELIRSNLSQEQEDELHDAFAKD